MSSLRAKLVLIYCLAALSGILITAALSYYGVETNVQTLAANRADGLADELAYSIEILGANRDPALVRSLLDKSAGLPDVALVFIVDSTNRLLISGDGRPTGLRQGSPYVLQALQHQAETQAVERDRLIMVRPLRFAGLGSRTQSNNGALWIEIDLAPAQAQSQRAFGAILGIVIGLLAFSVLGAFWVSDKLIFRRLERIKEGLRQVSAGDLNTHIQVPTSFGTSDEVNRLANQFNQTTDALRASQHALEVERDFAQLITNSIAQGLTVIDSAGMFEFVNPAYARMLKRRPEDLIGHSPDEVTHPDDLLRLAEIRAARQHGETSTYEMRLVAADGAILNVLITGAPRIVQGQISGSVSVVTDLTERARLEQMKSDFVNRAAHELRTPLAATMMMTDLIQEGGSAGELAEYWQVLRTEQARQRTLIEKLLMVGRLESGAFTLDPTPLQLEGPLREALTATETQAHSKAIQITVNVAPDLPAVLGDAEYLQQVFVNLLTNAFKFTPRKGAVRVTASPDERGVRVTIKDSGIGIPPEDRPHLFERFFRASNATRREIQGTGVGLFLVKSIVSQLGGSITLDSELNQGTTVSVWLPGAG